MCMAVGIISSVGQSGSSASQQEKTISLLMTTGEPLTANQGGETNTLSKSGMESFHSLAPVQHA